MAQFKLCAAPPKSHLLIHAPVRVFQNEIEILLLLCGFSSPCLKYYSDVLFEDNDHNAQPFWRMVELDFVVLTLDVFSSDCFSLRDGAITQGLPTTVVWRRDTSLRLTSVSGHCSESTVSFVCLTVLMWISLEFCLLWLVVSRSISIRPTA